MKTRRNTGNANFGHGGPKDASRLHLLHRMRMLVNVVYVTWASSPEIWLRKIAFKNRFDLLKI